MVAANPITVKDVIAEFDTEYKLAWDALKRLHVAGEIHIAAWGAPASGKAIPIYQAGSAADAPRPTALTRRDASRRCQSRRDWGVSAAQIDRELIARQAVHDKQFERQKAEVAQAMGVLKARLKRYEESYRATTERLQDAAALAKKHLDKSAKRKNTVPLEKREKVPDLSIAGQARALTT